MQNLPSKVSLDDDCITLINKTSNHIGNASYTEQVTQLFHQLFDSFKRASSSGDVFIEMKNQNQDDTVENGKTGLHRKLEGRHLRMVAIGGSIGTDLFIASGSALATSGPAALVIDFAFVGFMPFNVCMLEDLKWAGTML